MVSISCKRSNILKDNELKMLPQERLTDLISDKPLKFVDRCFYHGQCPTEIIKVANWKLLIKKGKRD